MAARRRGEPAPGERLYCAIRDQFAEQNVSPMMLGIQLLNALEDRAWEKAHDNVQTFLAAVERQLGL